MVIFLEDIRQLTNGKIEFWYEARDSTVDIIGCDLFVIIKTTDKKSSL